MAIILDGRARAAVARRRAHGRDAALFVHVERVRAGRRGLALLAVDWAPRQWPQCPLVAQQVGDVLVIMDGRIARYTRDHTLTVSAWLLGPLARVWVVGDVARMLDMVDWERRSGKAGRGRQSGNSRPPAA